MIRDSASSVSPSPWLVAGAFGIVYLVWGSTYLAIRFAIETLPPLLMAGTRFLTAGILLYALVAARNPRPTRRHWKNTAVSGLLMLFGANGLVCWAEQFVASGLAALLVATVSLWMVLLDWLVFRGSRPSLRVWSGVAIGLGGVGLLVDPAGLVGQPIHLGGAIGLVVACLLWAIGSLYSRRHETPSSPFQATAMQMLAGGVGLMIVGSLTGEWNRVDFAAISARSIMAVVYLIIFGSIVALSSYVWLLQVSTPARVATYAYVNPVVAMGLGFFLAGEPITPRSLTAAGIILAGVCLITSAPRKRSSPPRRRATVLKHLVIALGPRVLNLARQEAPRRAQRSDRSDPMRCRKGGVASTRWTSLAIMSAWELHAGRDRPMSADHTEPSVRTRVQRLPERGQYDRDLIYRIIDEALICHVGFIEDEQPFVIPTIHARIEDNLYLHGSPGSRMLRRVDQAPLCVTMTLLDGLVLARSAFHHSMNYRSVVILSQGAAVEDHAEKARALDALVEHVIPGRTADARGPNAFELRSTLVVRVPINETSAKVRSGPPGDEEEDYALPIWAGTIPLALAPGAPQTDPRLTPGIPCPDYVRGYKRG